MKMINIHHDNAKADSIDFENQRIHNEYPKVGWNISFPYESPNRLYLNLLDLGFFDFAQYM